MPQEAVGTNCEYGFQSSPVRELNAGKYADARNAASESLKLEKRRASGWGRPRERYYFIAFPSLSGGGQPAVLSEYEGLQNAPRYAGTHNPPATQR
jgi:hypothetical protein